MSNGNTNLHAATPLSERYELTLKLSNVFQVDIYLHKKISGGHKTPLVSLHQLYGTVCLQTLLTLHH